MSKLSRASLTRREARGTQEWGGGPKSSGASASASGTRVDCHATRLPAILRLDIHNNVTKTDAGVLSARCDLHARRAGHNPCPAVDADRAGFRDDGLVAELTNREGVEKLRFPFVRTTGLRVRQIGRRGPF